MPRRPEPCRRPATTRRAASSAALAIVGAALLTACVFPGPDDGPEPSSTLSSPSASQTPTPSLTPSSPPAPEMNPDGTAADNLAYFRAIVEGVWATPDNASGRAYIDALTAAGFEKASMQVTHDESTVGNPAESIQFSVLWKGECLVGQVGPATGTPVAVVLPALGDGACLIGSTRPIDW